MSQSSKIAPRNLAAQLSYRGRGNPPVAHPSSAISNCFPGLEFDFRAIWRRIFVGIVLSENNNTWSTSRTPRSSIFAGGAS